MESSCACLYSKVHKQYLIHKKSSQCTHPTDTAKIYVQVSRQVRRSRWLALYDNSVFIMDTQVLLTCCKFITVLSLAHSQNTSTMEGIPVEVNRAFQADTYLLHNNNMRFNCNSSEGTRSTYIVAERRCVDNQQFFNGIKLMITLMR